MLEIYRVKEEGSEGFASWLTKQPGIEEISRMLSDDDGTLVFLLRNTGAELDADKIPGYGSTVKRVPEVRYNFEFNNLSELMSVLDPDDPSTIGADYIYDLINDSTRSARPVTAHVSDTNEGYVIIRRDGNLVPVIIQ